MLRKPLAIAAAAVALAAAPPAFAMHGPKEQPPRVPRDMESPRLAQASLVIQVSAGGSFSWLDAGIGASVTAGCAVLLVGGRRAVRLRHAS
jgi:hypothetical protein